jgi:hypothetical protein
VLIRCPYRRGERRGKLAVLTAGPAAAAIGAQKKQGSSRMSHTPFRRTTAIAAAVIAGLAAPAFAQDGGGEEPRRTRIGAGAHLYPSYPGSDSFDIGPMVDLDRARGDEPFEFEAPDDSFSLALVDSGGFELGPVVNFEGERTAEDVGAALPKVKFSLEPGAFVAVDLGESFRLRAEVRKGVTGHKGWIGLAGADWVARDGDEWLFSIGPRVTWSNDRYHDASTRQAPPPRSKPSSARGGAFPRMPSTTAWSATRRTRRSCSSSARATSSRAGWR